MWYNKYNKRDKEGELNDNDFISNSSNNCMRKNWNMDNVRPSLEPLKEKRYDKEMDY